MPKNLWVKYKKIGYLEFRHVNIEWKLANKHSFDDQAHRTFLIFLIKNKVMIAK